MKSDMISSYHSTPKSAIVNPFDPNKFVRRIQYKDSVAKDKNSWWNRFMEGVEHKKKEIHRDLSVYRKGN